MSMILMSSLRIHIIVIPAQAGIYKYLIIFVYLLSIDSQSSWE